MSPSAVLAAASDFANQTQVHPVGLTIMAIGCAALVAVRRPMAPVPLFAIASLIPGAQRIAIAGADFTLLRLTLLVGLARIFIRRELLEVRLCWLDGLVVAGSVAKIAVMAVQGGGATGGATLAVGNALDALGAYFIIRASVRSVEDIYLFARWASRIALVMAGALLVEWTTRKNLFAAFGGVKLDTAIREGRLRCQGPFGHPILTGCYWVSLLPLWMSMMRGKGVTRKWGILGTGAAHVIVFCCASSTPAMGVILAWIAFAAWGIRQHLRAVWIGLLALAVVLHFSMEKGIWHLLGRIDLVGGSTGYHRYRLIRAAIDRFGEWWLSGTTSTAHWGWGLKDVTNHYILEGCKGGVWAFSALLGQIIVAYATVGRLLRRRGASIRATSMYFALGASVFCQMAMFLSIAYYGGQASMVWFIILGSIASMGEVGRRSARPE